ncbi:MAG: hypothetical protein CMC89_00375 [Flavobacteriaceae bacterium]|nr:hypothetical protein [Flavobacteriaceae bacterium]
MRFNQFKLTEDEVQQQVQQPKTAEEYVDLIQDKADEAPDDVQRNILNALERLKEYLKKKIEVQTKNPVSTPSQEGIEDDITKKANDVEYLLELAKEKGLPEDPKTLAVLRQVAGPLMKAGAQVGHQGLDKIEKEIESYYDALSNKITKGGKGFAPVVELPDNKDADGYEEAMAYAREMAQKRSELSKTGLAVRQTIADMTNVIIQKARRTEEILEAEKELIKIKEFLQYCVEDPFINFDTMISKPQGTVEQEFQSSANGKKYLEVFKNFGNILGRTIDQSGAGAWGPGELGLLMLSDPVKKGSKGDIETGSGKQVEVKASKKAGSGARLNVDKAKKGNMVKDYNKVLTKYFGNTVMVDDEKVQVQHQMEQGQLNFTTRGFNILNSFIDQLPKWNKAKAISFLKDAVGLPMENYIGTSDYDKGIDNLSRAVDEKGRFNMPAFQREYTKLLFTIYQSEMLDAILIINPIMGTFLVMNSPDEVDDTVNRGMVITGGIDFKDGQSTKSPQIGVGALAN